GGAREGSAPGAPACGCGGWTVGADAGERVWGDISYLLWWIKDGPLGVPLVNTGNPSNPLAGVIGQPDTRTLFGGSGLDYGTFSGMSGTLGFWLDQSATLGLQATGFLLQRRS